MGGFTSKPPHRCPGLIWSLGIRDNPISCSAPCWCLCRKRQGQGRGQRPFRAAAPFPPVVPSNGEKAGNTKGKIYSSIAKKSRLLSLSQYRTLMSWTGRLQPAAPESSPLLRMSTNPQCAVLPYTLPIHPRQSMQMLSNIANNFTFAIKIFIPLALISSSLRKRKVL